MCQVKSFSHDIPSKVKVKKRKHQLITPKVAHVTSLKSGTTSVIMRRFDLEPFLAAIQNFQITEMLLVPPIVIAIIMSGLGEKYSLKSVRSVAIGAAPLGKDSQDKLKTLLDPRTTVTQVWGMTEASCVVTMFYYPEDDDTGSVGRLMPNLEAKYDSLSPLPPFLSPNSTLESL